MKKTLAILLAAVLMLGCMSFASAEELQQFLGLTPGAPVCCVGSSPGGDPAAYRVRQTILALRRADAATIWVRPVEEAESYGADQRSRGAGCGT